MTDKEKKLLDRVADILFDLSSNCEQCGPTVKLKTMYSIIEKLKSEKLEKKG